MRTRGRLGGAPPPADVHEKEKLRASDSPASHVTLTGASTEDAAELARLHAAAFPPGAAWSAETITTLLGLSGVFGLRGAGGFILARRILDEAEILTLGVPQAHQRHGLARKLVEALVRAARKSEVKKLFLEVGAENAPALALYTKVGFQKAAERKGYYVRPGKPAEDAIVMVMQL